MTPPGPKSSPDPLRLGHVSGVFGVRGEVRLFLHNRESGALSGGLDVVLVSPDGVRREVFLRSRPGSGRRVLGAIRGVGSPQDAQAFVDWEIEIDSAQLPKLESEEFYWRDVLSSEVWTEGQRIGKVTRVHPSGPHEMLEVRLDAGGVGFVPALRTHVLSIEPGRIDVADGSVAAL